MDSPLSANKLLCDWLSFNFHYSFSLQREHQQQIIGEVIKTIGEPCKAIKMSEYATAYQTENFLFISINKRFCQVQFQGKYFLEGSLIEAGTLIKKVNEKLIRLENIEGRNDTNISLSISRIDIQKTKVATDPMKLFNVEA